MADRTNYFFQQPVQEDELDLGFEGLQNADRDQNIDMGLAAVDVSTEDGGIMVGLEVPSAPFGGLSALITAGASYDNLGRRVATDSNLSLDLSATGIRRVASPWTTLPHDSSSTT